MIIGFWHRSFFPVDFWQEDFWPEFIAAHHHIYCGQDGDIDYSSLLAEMAEGDSQVTVVDQGLPANTIWHYIRCQVSSCGLESQDSPPCVVIIDSNGDMIGSTPNPPISLIIERLSNGRFRLRWRYTKLSEEVTPIGFNIYMDSGSGFNFSSLDATIAYGIGGINNEFSWISGALTHGQLYRFCVRSYRTGSSDWISPTSHNDVNSKWTNPANAYDDDTSTFAIVASDGIITDYLELILASPIRSDKIRFWAKTKTNDINIDVYYEGGWHDVYRGTDFVDSEWVEKEYPEGIKIVEKARVSIEAVELHLAKRLFEFDFYGKAIIESQNTDYVATDADSEGPAAITDLQASYEEI